MINSYEEHPYPSFYNNDIEYLIIGSFPPIKLTSKIIGNDELGRLYSAFTRCFNKNTDIDFYYGSEDNYFWPLLRKIYNKELSNPKEIKDFLKKMKFGITDLFEKCRRKIIKGKIDSSDKRLIDQDIRKINDIFKACTKLKTIYFTSKWVFIQFKKNHQNDFNYNFEILESPSKSYNRYIGRIPEYKRRKHEYPNYNTCQYRLEKYREKLPFIEAQSGQNNC
ncbi:MAG: hypothetical protein Q7J16_05725 [Candidatus Cloacimonadales bacterium]|nr:hypothetical protein [Candidatus Cloacimonadales bacterium]